jgi:hypothetical protein
MSDSTKAVFLSYASAAFDGASAVAEVMADKSEGRQSAEPYSGIFTGVNGENGGAFSLSVASVSSCKMYGSTKPA